MTSETSTIQERRIVGDPCATGRFTKAVIQVDPAVLSSLCVVVGLQRLLFFPANSELDCY